MPTPDMDRPDTPSTDLQQEIGQHRPFGSPAEVALVGLFRTASMLRRRYAAVFEPYGLTPSQYNVLRILRGAEAPLPTMAIRDRLIEETPGVTRLVSGLAGKGLAERERSAEDRRRVLCRITEEGLRLLEELDDPVDRFDAGAMDPLSPEDQKALARLLGAVREPLLAE